MEVKYSLDSRCRTCFSYNEQLQSIFDVQISGTESVYVTDFLRRLTTLKYAKGDGLPENICNVCIEQICQAFSFAQVCNETDNTLRSYLERKLEVKETKLDDIDHLSTSDFLLCNTDSSPRPHDDPSTLQTPPTTTNHHSDTCPKRFNTRKTLNKRVRAHSPTDYPFTCAECNQGFVKQMHLNIHLRAHKKPDEKAFKCEQCDAKFAYAYLLKQHTYKHTRDKPYPCTVCAKGCLTAESLRRHMTVHAATYRKKVHACAVCAKTFAYPSFLAEHMKNHTREKPFLCARCGKGFRQSGALEYHTRTHMGVKPYACNVCDSSFMSRSVLRVHMRRHTNERPYGCDVCGMAFKQSSDMKSHRRIHTGDKPVLCSVCGKRMSTTGQLTVHLRSHTGEKPFPCTFCDKPFTTRAMLVKHVRIHTGERPYVCTTCGKSFNQSSTLKTHAKTHEKQRYTKVEPVVEEGEEHQGGAHAQTLFAANGGKTELLLDLDAGGDASITVVTVDEIAAQLVHVPDLVLGENRIIQARSYKGTS